MIFTVRRKINGVTFLKDEDRIIADNWEAAEIILMQGIASGRYDETCVLDGEIVYEEEISDDAMLDIMIDIKMKYSYLREILLKHGAKEVKVLLL